jgi:hypothetical protein
MEIYAIYDSVSGSFNCPFFLVNEATARRVCFDMVHNKDTTLALHPSDFVLYRLGHFDMVSGNIEAVDKPEMVCNLGTFIKSGD